jgi:hypothetical protein
MTVGYWLKGDSCIRIDGEPHSSAILRSPARFGVDPDSVTFAFDNHGDGGEIDDVVRNQVLHNGWIKIRRYEHPETEHWSIVFAEFSRSRLEIVSFLQEMLSQNTERRPKTSLSLDGIEDGFHEEISLGSGGPALILNELGIRP